MKEKKNKNGVFIKMASSEIDKLYDKVFQRRIEAEKNKQEK